MKLMLTNLMLFAFWGSTLKAYHFYKDKGTTIPLESTEQDEGLIPDSIPPRSPALTSPPQGQREFQMDEYEPNEIPYVVVLDAPFINYLTSPKNTQMAIMADAVFKQPIWAEGMNLTSNTGQGRDNLTMGNGFNFSYAGTRIDPRWMAWGESWESFYHPSAGDSIFEWHRMMVDMSDIQYRLESVTAHMINKSSWEKYYTLGRLYLKDPTNLGTFAFIERVSTTGSSLKLFGSASLSGVQLFADASATNFQIAPDGYTGTNRYVYINDWNAVALPAMESNKIGETSWNIIRGQIQMPYYKNTDNTAGDPVNIINTDLNGNFRSDPLADLAGYGIIFTNGHFEIDTFLILNTASDDDTNLSAHGPNKPHERMVYSMETATTEDMPRFNTFGSLQNQNWRNVTTTMTMDEGDFGIRVISPGQIITLPNLTTTNNEGLGTICIIYNRSEGDITVDPGSSSDTVNGSNVNLTLSTLQSRIFMCTYIGISGETDWISFNQ